MSKHKNSYIKYKRAELEEYIRHPESCVKKIRTVEALRFAPNVIVNFKDSIMRILSKKIGKYDAKLDGVVLDFRKTQILNTGSLVRNDSTSMLINVETDFYVFSPRTGAIVNGIVKHINHQNMETIISVVIYRVFNVKVAFKRSMKQQNVDYDKEIQIRIKDFHFDDVIPFIEGDMISVVPSARKKIIYDDTADSGISESSASPNTLQSTDIVVKQEPVDDIEYDEPINAFDSGISRKRKRNTDNVISQTPQPMAKRIKQEIESTPSSPVKIKQEKNSDSEEEQEIDETPQKKKDNNDLNVTGIEDISQKKKKKKKNKRKDDFESSLLELFGSPAPPTSTQIQIKQEKD